MASTPHNSADRRRRRASGWILGATLLLGLLLSLQHVRDHCLLPLMDYDTEERAGSARELLETGHWSAETLRYWELVGHEQLAAGRPWPVQIWSLGYPLVLAGAFALFGIRDVVAVGLPIAAFLGCLALAFFLARHLWGLRVAALTCLFLLTENTLVYWSAHGTLEPVYTACVLGAVLLLVARPRRPSAAVAAGLLMGLAYFLRPTALAWFPFLLLAGLHTTLSLRRRMIPAALAGLLVALILAVTLTHRLSVSPLPSRGPSINYTQALLRETGPDQVISGATAVPRPIPTRELLAAGYLAPKLARGLREGLRELLTGYPPSLLLLGVVGILLALTDRRTRGLAGFTLLAMILAFGGTILTAFYGLNRYFCDFAPLLAVFAALAVLWGWRQVSPVGWVGKLVLMVLVAGLMAKGFANYRMPFHAAQPQAESYYLGRAVAARTPPGAIIGSVEAMPIAWHGHRRCIATPLLPGPDKTRALVEIDWELQRLDAVVVAEEELAGPPPERLGLFVKADTFAVPLRWPKGADRMHRYTMYVRGSG